MISLHEITPTVSALLTGKAELAGCAVIANGGMARTREQNELSTNGRFITIDPIQAGKRSIEAGTRIGMKVRIPILIGINPSFSSPYEILPMVTAVISALINYSSFTKEKFQLAEDTCLMLSELNEGQLSYQLIFEKEVWI